MSHNNQFNKSYSCLTCFMPSTDDIEVIIKHFRETGHTIMRNDKL